MSHKHTSLSRTCTRGFTLLELMLVIAIVGILASLSAGFSGTYIRTQKLRTSARAVQSAISMARADAVRTSSVTNFSITNNVIYAYKDLNKNGAYDASDTLIFRYPAATDVPLPSTTTMSIAPPSGGLPTGSAQPGFNLEGLYLDVTGSPATVVVCVKDTGLNDVRAIQMSITGACRTVGMPTSATLCP